MKKKYYLFSFIAAFLMTACTHEEENFFEHSSAQRADEAIKATTQILTSTSNGWLMEYFPSSNQRFGGYSILFQFKADGNVTVGSEWTSDTNAVSTSTYSVKQSAGIVLSFDTYNEIFHFFSDPAAPGGIGSTGSGMAGDYDFLVLEATATKVVLKGKKSGSQVTLTPFSGIWSDYLSSIQSADETMTSSAYQLKIGEERIPVSASYRTLTFSYEEDGESKSKKASYIVIPTGYKFYEPIEIKGKTISGFTFDSANGRFNEFNDNAIQLMYVPINQSLVEGSWYIAYSTLGEFAQPLFDICKASIAAENEVLQYAYIGKNADTVGFGFHFQSGTYKGSIGIGYTLSGENKITMQYNETSDGNGGWYLRNAAFNNMVEPFGYATARTFTLTTDKITTPTYIILTDEAEPTNVIKLHKSVVSRPFDN